ncbi:MAG TPA: 23S rRNA (guanosine(2251)-2'-O)-methyltransferase RlmB [Flavobacteriaceae bacterium]|nr:23S rRNA (guanosine(2251)-2'-O)-methyltransferase RlmB [Flavobacteriaceae bacterium]|tara:strand:- start:4645 stop:5379 length:735 start_codon:yes stop_codon:yes gene_type:complete
MEKSLDIYGIRTVIEAIKSGDKTIDKIFIQIGLTGGLINELEALIRKNKLKSSYVPTQKLDKLSKKNHQGVIARISPIEFYKLQEIMDKIEDKKDALLLILDQINDVRNFGAIIRTAEVSGVDAIIVQNQSSAPINADTVKTSAGGVFNVPICKVSHIKDAIYHLKSSNITVIAASEKADKNIYDLSLKKSVAIIMGSEERGISSSVIKLSDEVVKLPMFGKIESLNVSVASGIFLYEVIRQRI